MIKLLIGDRSEYQIIRKSGRRRSEEQSIGFYN